MASTKTIEQTPVSRPAKAGPSLLSLMLAMLAAVVVALGVLGGAAFWLYKSGRLPGFGDTHAAAATPATEAVKPLLAQVVLEPVVVNLADTDGRSYLRVAVTLMVEQRPPEKAAKGKEEKPDKGKTVNESEAAERDALLDVLGRQTGEALLAPEGKEHLKQQIRAALKQHVPDVTVNDVLFTDFLVQR